MLAKNYLIMTSRGCPFNCSYCGNNTYYALYSHEKNHVRRRSPQNVIEELKLAKKKWKIRLVCFADDVFTSSKEWLKEFIPLYKSEINIPFFCSVHPLSISLEKAALLKDGGCWLVTMGVQSGSEKIRCEIFHRKGTNEQILESINNIKNAGIKISLDNIFGAPTETIEDLEQTFELYNKAKVDRIITFWLTYFPGTKILDYARDYKRLSEKDIIDISRGKFGDMLVSGSIKEGIKTYRQFELKIQLRTLLMNDKLYAFACKWVRFFPLKGLAKKLIVFLNGIKNRDVRMFNYIEYVLSKKNIP